MRKKRFLIILLAVPVIGLATISLISSHWKNMKLTKSIHFEIGKDRESVFDYVSNTENNKHWLSGVTHVKKETQGPVDIGTEFTFKRNLAGEELEGIVKVVSFDRPTKYAYKSHSANFLFTLSYRFQRIDDHRTAVDFEVLWELKGLYFKLLGWVYLIVIKGNFEKDFENLKKVLE